MPCDLDGIRSRSVSSGAFTADKESRQAAILQALCEISDALGAGAGGSSSATLISNTGDNNQVSVDTTAGGTTIVAARTGRKTVHIKNHDASVAVYVGFGTVSTTNGFELAAGEGISLHTTLEVKGIVGSGSVTVGYIDEYST